MITGESDEHLLQRFMLSTQLTSVALKVDYQFELLSVTDWPAN